MPWDASSRSARNAGPTKDDVEQAAHAKAQAPHIARAPQDRSRSPRSCQAPAQASLPSAPKQLPVAGRARSRSRSPNRKDGNRSDGLIPGGPVEVFYEGRWYIGELVLRRPNGRMQVLVDGLEYEVDWTDVRRVTQDPAASAFSRDEAIEVLYQGIWFDAVVIAASVDGKVRVRGGGTEYDVDSKDIRRKQTITKNKATLAPFPKPRSKQPPVQLLGAPRNSQQEVSSMGAGQVSSPLASALQLSQSKSASFRSESRQSAAGPVADPPKSEAFRPKLPGPAKSFSVPAARGKSASFQAAPPLKDGAPARLKATLPKPRIPGADPGPAPSGDVAKGSGGVALPVPKTPRLPLPMPVRPKGFLRPPVQVV